jgi:LmbE family N-acetylglucosaminyl deacetylase
MPRLIAALAALVGAILLSASTPSAQLRPQPVGELPGAASLQLMLRKLGSIGTFMQTDAHPDDEDNALLAMLGHGQGMRTVLVTATRGDGGQNEIGPELFQSLGVLRTEELLAVHRFDGAEQFFTRAVDFGFSFSVEESIEKWGHDEVLGDFVRHIRALRPDVIAGFLCGGEGGGQHHQASTRLTHEAFRAAADPAKYPEQLAEGLRPWQAQRVFCTEAAGFSPASPQALTRDQLRVDVSAFDPILGRTYSDLGIEARSMHKCQGTSQLLPLPGQSFTRTYKLLDSTVEPGDRAPDSLYDGIDTSLQGLLRFAGDHPPAELVTGLSAIQSAIADAATSAAHIPAASAPALASGLGAVRALRGKLSSMGLSEGARYEIEFRLERKEAEFQQALLLAYGMRFEALADDGAVVAGQPLKLSFALANNGPADVALTEVTIAGLDGAAASCRGVVARGRAHTCEGGGRVPADAAVTGPYWKPRADAARYDFEPDAPFGLPFRPSPFRATFRLSVGGADVQVERALQFRQARRPGGMDRQPGAACGDVRAGGRGSDGDVRAGRTRRPRGRRPYADRRRVGRDRQLFERLRRHRVPPHRAAAGAGTGGRERQGD